MKLSSIAVLFTISGVTAVAQNGVSHPYARTSCPELNRAAITQAASGRLAEAEASLAGTPISGDERSQGICSGYVLGNLAKTMFAFGRPAEAERLAEQAVRTLEKFYPPNDRVLLPPLHTLAAARLESGKTGRAKEAVKRMQSIRTEDHEDRAIIHATVGALLQIEGRRTEAEVEYQDALRGLEEAGRGESADAASVLNCLGSLYLAEQRLDEAWHTLERAFAIYNRAKDSVPFDRFKFLDLRGVLHARLGEWRQSEQDLGDALSLIDRQLPVDPDLLRLLLENYAYVLRRNHHRREARSIEARRAALPKNRATTAVVDLTELFGERKAARE